MPPTTLTPPRPAATFDRTPERSSVPPPAPDAYADSLVDPRALDAARDAVARYFGELGLPVNSRPAATATAACLDAAYGEVGPSAGSAELTRVALRHAALGMSRWLAELAGRVPTPPPHAALAARLSGGSVRAVPALRRGVMTPQRFGT